MKASRSLRLASEGAFFAAIYALLGAVKLAGISKARIFPEMSQWCSLIPGIVGRALRAALLRNLIRETGQNVTIDFGTIFSSTKCVLGENVYIGAFCSIGYAEIGADTLIGTGVYVMAPNTHGFRDPTRKINQQDQTSHRVKIGRDCWVGNGAIVMADVGDRSVIGAGAVVTKPIPPWSIAVGVPAGVIESYGPERLETPKEP